MTNVKPIKLYAEVKVNFSDDSRMRPCSILWEDGKRYTIDKVSNIKQAAAIRADGQGDRYTIWIGGKQSYLFFERNGSVTGYNIGR